MPSCSSSLSYTVKSVCTCWGYIGQSQPVLQAERFGSGQNGRPIWQMGKSLGRTTPNVCLPPEMCVFVGSKGLGLGAFGGQHPGLKVLPGFRMRAEAFCPPGRILPGKRQDFCLHSQLDRLCDTSASSRAARRWQGLHKLPADVSRLQEPAQSYRVVGDASGGTAQRCHHASGRAERAGTRLQTRRARVTLS